MFIEFIEVIIPEVKLLLIQYIYASHLIKDQPLLSIKALNPCFW